MNTTVFSTGEILDGFYECTVMKGLMVENNVEFFAEIGEFHGKAFHGLDVTQAWSVQKSTTTADGERCIRFYDQLDSKKDLSEELEKVRVFLEAISLAIDAPLPCHRIAFVSQHHGPVLQAFRRSVGRGIGFEVEERSLAKEKVARDLGFYQDQTDQHLTVGRRHYLAGMQLLALEDQIAGLLDAAFMQFYQGCEVLCRDPMGSLEPSKKLIAMKNPVDSRALQIIAHQVWRVRNKYFGHGDVARNLFANENVEQASAVARQVLVARYLCRRLFDLDVPSGIPLVREMGIFFGGYSTHFSGDLSQLIGQFGVPFDQTECRVYDASGVVVEVFSFAAP